MTSAATLSAPPDLSGPRHPILAIGSGLVGLIATKALKLAQLNITDALVFVTGAAVHDTPRLFRQASQWTPLFPAAITVSVLVTLLAAAAIDVVKLIAVKPDSRWITQNDRRIALRRPRPLAKGLV
jgi:nucleoside recognition membrane protein YjiH